MIDRIDNASRSLHTSGPAPRADPVVCVSGKHEMTARNEINSVAADLSSKPPVDSDKVERLRASIGAGHYPLDPARIADAMIGQELTFR